MGHLRTRGGGGRRAEGERGKGMGALCNAGSIHTPAVSQVTATTCPKLETCVAQVCVLRVACRARGQAYARKAHTPKCMQVHRPT